MAVATHRAILETSPSLLEDLLEALAKADFPIDPDLRYDRLRGVSYVSFPIAESQKADLEDLLLASGFGTATLRYEANGEPVASSAADQAARFEFE